MDSQARNSLRTSHHSDLDSASGAKRKTRRSCTPHGGGIAAARGAAGGLLPLAHGGAGSARLREGARPFKKVFQEARGEEGAGSDVRLAAQVTRKPGDNDSK
jgi:hypothetical protein